jgi:LPXTG-motif cell wall-anchored protein
VTDPALTGDEQNPDEILTSDASGSVIDTNAGPDAAGGANIIDQSADNSAEGGKTNAAGYALWIAIAAIVAIAAIAIVFIKRRKKDEAM